MANLFWINIKGWEHVSWKAHTSRQMFWVLVIDEILCYRWVPFADPHTIGHPAYYIGHPAQAVRSQCTNWCNFWRHLHIQRSWKTRFTSIHSNIPNTHIRIGILQMLHQYPETWATLPRESRCQLYSKWNFLANLDLKYTKVSNCTLREGNLKYQRTFWPSH